MYVVVVFMYLYACGLYFECGVGRHPRVSLGVVLVKGMSLCIRVKRPPPPRIGRSCLSVVYPGKEGVVLVVVNLLSWIVAM